MRKSILLTLLLLVSCSEFVKMVDDTYQDKIVISQDKAQFKILFSNNINGETHPCGCRQHPRGGLPQVAGVFAEQSKDSSIIYVDTGDTFFASTKIPEPIRESSTFTANKIAEALAKLNISFYVPGDQDFALGEEFLAQLLKKHKIPVVLSNINKTSIKHTKWGHVKYGDLNLFFIGIVHPDVFFSISPPELVDPLMAIPKTIAEIEKEYSSVKNKKFILLSHSGMDIDKTYAKKFPKLSWIIGSHSQSYTTSAYELEKSKLVQVLSRNHYIGAITFKNNLNKPAKFSIHETSEEKALIIKDNPWISWLGKYKEDLEKIQAKEQGFFKTDNSQVKFKTYTSCIECHQKQGDFWQETSHSIAWQTLINSKAEHNPNCIKCHSLGHSNPKGFKSSHDVFGFPASSDTEKHREKYHLKLKAIMADVKSVRELAPSKRQELSKNWVKLDKEFKLEHNFANVQCLHCHQKDDDHPFDAGESKKVAFEKTCTGCHTRDQSPEWYDKDDKGLATELNKTYFAKALKKVTCPKE